jgi:hypothetical protein
MRGTDLDYLGVTTFNSRASSTQASHNRAIRGQVLNKIQFLGLFHRRRARRGIVISGHILGTTQFMWSLPAIKYLKLGGR